jgi:hypothetical protein
MSELRCCETHEDDFYDLRLELQVAIAERNEARDFAEKFRQEIVLEGYTVAPLPWSKK